MSLLEMWNIQRQIFKDKRIIILLLCLLYNVIGAVTVVIFNLGNWLWAWAGFGLGTSIVGLLYEMGLAARRIFQKNVDQVNEELYQKFISDEKDES